MIFLKPSLPTIFATVSIGFAFFIFCLIDAVKKAGEGKNRYEIKKYNKWYFYLFCLAAASLIIQPAVKTTIKKNFIQAYKIPSEAMNPTILKGDYILVDKFIYKKLEPKRGEIIIFPSPNNPSQDFIKRLIGLEGDIIEIKNKQLYINGEKYLENYITNSDPNVLSSKASPRDNYGPITIPKGKYFVMGDNRDNSYDSRFWKFVKKNEIKGKAKSIYWSWDSKAHEVRWKRIGKAFNL
ncbi:MAG: signal peptidase I [Deltaproteobacteria bacterium]|nr:MAG: signal peptidase I [Deltaproteobacteria bacterium]